MLKRFHDRSGLLVAMAFGLATLAMSFAGTASAQSCTGTTCDLGGQLRFQVGQGLPIPITLQPAQTGLITSHPGAIQAVPGATIMQTTGPAPRALTIGSAQFTYDEPLVQIPVFLANPAVLAVGTNLGIENPAPGQTGMFFAGGRTGPATVTWCAGSPPPTASFNPGCLGPATTASGGAPLVNGLVRYVATRNQFGGLSFGRTTGTAQVYFNANNLTINQLPCTGGAGAGCLVAISQATPATQAANGQPFGVTAMNPPDVNPAGIRSANIGPVGTVISLGNTFGPFTGQGATSWGFPLTTGMLTISVTQNLGPVNSIFVRTGVDGRNANGSGIVVMVSGTVSARTLSGPNANRGVATLRIPEPGVLVAGSAGLLMLGGCHWLVRRRQG